MRSTIMNSRFTIFLVISVAIFCGLPQTKAGADALFSDPVFTPVGPNPSSVETGDFNRDSVVDLAITLMGSNRLSIFIGNGTGAFYPTATYPMGNGPAAMAIGDTNGDDILDLAVANSLSDFFTLLLGNGDGSFQIDGNYTTGDHPIDLSMDDFDGDGDLDIALIDYGSRDLKVYRGNGYGAYFQNGNYTVNTFPSGVTLDDFDGDSIVDIVVASEGNYTASVFKGFGNGQFMASQHYAAGHAPQDITHGDVNNDNVSDLVVANSNDRVNVLLNYGDGSFTSPSDYYAGDQPTALAMSDLDGDGDLDAVIADAEGDTLAILKGIGNGAFEGATLYNVGDRPRDVKIADFDGDGDLDIVVVNSNSNDIAVLFNTTNSVRFIVTGPGPGENDPPRVRLFNADDTNEMWAEWNAYGVNKFGVNVAVGNVEGGHGYEVITGAGPGAVFGPHVRGFYPDGNPIPNLSYFAYGTHKWGVNVTCGDIDGDGLDEIITGAGPGAVFGPHVRGWNWDGSGAISPIGGVSFMAYGTPKWGVNVASGDIDGDGYDEIVTGAGPGTIYGPHVRGWNWDGSGAAQSISSVSFLAYGTNQWGVNVACGDIDGDGIDEIVTGPGPGTVFGPHVRAWDWDGVGSARAISAVSFFAYPYSEWGANVGCGDVDNDGISEILTGPGPGTNFPAWVKGWNYDGGALVAIPRIDFHAYDLSMAEKGVKVAGIN